MDHNPPIAHVSEDGRCHRLQDHLLGTASRARQLAAEFGASEWAYIAGLWHDLGKFSQAFQNKILSAADPEAHIEAKPGRVDHSTAGAIWAVEQMKGRGRVLAYLVAGHHAGLPEKGGSAMQEPSHTSHRGYEVGLEVAGPLAMFARPDTGGTPTSYPVPTWSAAKGLFESIAFFADGSAWICPMKVEICRPVGEPGGRVRFQRYTTNYGGPLRKKDLFRKGTAPGGSSMQLFATVLSGVCYRIHGIVVGPRLRNNINARHHLKDLFDRRLRQGRCFRTPCLGWSEFTCSYWGPFRAGLTEVDSSISLKVPSMLFCVWDHPTSGQYSPAFHQDVEVGGILGGEMRYDVPPAWLAEILQEGVADAQ